MALGTRRRRISGHQLVEQLNDVVAQLIKENRKLKRQVEKLTARGTSAASGTVDRSLRTIQRRVQKALTAPAKRKRRRGAGLAAAAKKVVRKRRTPKAPG
jgi:cell division septum initiation protein DivIVA